MFHILAVVMIEGAERAAEVEFWCGTDSEVFICSMLQQNIEIEVLHMDIERVGDG